MVIANTQLSHYRSLRISGWLTSAFVVVALVWLAGLAAVRYAAYSQGKTLPELFRYLHQQEDCDQRVKPDESQHFSCWVLDWIPAQSWQLLLSSYTLMLGVDVLAAPLPWRVPAIPSFPEPPAIEGSAQVSDGDAIWRSESTLRVGPNQRYQTVGAAIRAAKSGSTIEVEPGEYRGDTASIVNKDLRIRALGPNVRLLADGAHAEGKGIWVVRGGRVEVDGITFAGARVGDSNGAGIRFDAGHLTVRRCLFHGNQNGILVSNQPDAELFVQDSEFGYNGNGDGLSHSLYAGSIARLEVVGSYFHHGYVGHHIKSRARVSVIVGNRVTDEAGGRASYELEFPNGGLVMVASNLLEQNRENSNSNMVSFGAEGYMPAESRLFLLHNTLVNNEPRGGTMVRIAPGDRSAVLANNLWVGVGGVLSDGLKVDQLGNRRADWEDFTLPVRYAFRLRRSEAFPAKPLDPLAVPPIGWARYEHPARHVRMPGAPPHAGAW